MHSEQQALSFMLVMKYPHRRIIVAVIEKQSGIYLQIVARVPPTDIV